jgi:ankyrin repeat protein
VKKTTYRIVAIVLWLTSGSAWSGSFDDFFVAVNLDDERTVRQLLARGFDPNAVNEQGHPALLLAMREGSPRVSAVLLSAAQTRVDQPNASGETAVMMAALRGDLVWTARLLDRGAALNRAGWAPLHYAACGPEARVVQLLLDRGGAVDAPSPNRSTPLMMAARYGPESAVEVLLRRGANLDARNDQGLNAADFARLGGREALARRLDAAPR